VIPPFPIVTNLQMRPLCAAATVSPAGNYLHCDAARFEGLDELRYHYRCGAPQNGQKSAASANTLRQNRHLILTTSRVMISFSRICGVCSAGE